MSCSVYAIFNMVGKLNSAVDGQYFGLFATKRSKMRFKLDFSALNL